VGKVTQKVLAAQGIHTGADLLQHRGLLEVCRWMGWAGLCLQLDGRYYA
jgi:hypothetical protein